MDKRRLFIFKLAAMLGVTPDVLLSSLTARDLALWQAFLCAGGDE